MDNSTLPPCPTSCPASCARPYTASRPPNSDTCPCGCRQFSERLYWDKRYQQDPTTFEWYRSYESLKPILTQ